MERAWGDGRLAEVLKAACPPHLAAVDAYWLLDVDVPSLRVLELVDGGFAERAFVTGREPVTVTQPFAVTVVPADLLV